MRRRILAIASAAAIAMLHARGADSSAGTPAAHWAFQPIHRPDSPVVKRNRKTANPIDAFTTAKLTESRLAFSREANRRTLIRRLYFDVIGLPPSPEKVESFVADKDPRAYEKLVEKLLASPRYGERWARHWLDVVRFAESHGFEMNQPRPNAWRYRDYVIRALNEDKPYDRFVVEQIAGDVLGVDEATGFLVGGPWDQVKSPDPVLTANQRADELHDIVSTTSSAFLGLTVGCARCHNHKFDPIPQTDYFAIKAVFEGVQHGERKLRSADSAAREKELRKAQQRLAEVENELERFEPLATPTPGTNSLRAPVNARKNVERFSPITARKVRFTILKTTDAEPCIDELEIYAANETSQTVALAANGTTARASSVYPNSDMHRLEHINDGRHGNSRSWISNERGKGWLELEFSNTVTISKIVWSRDREQRYSDRLTIDYRIEVATGANNWQVVASSLDRQPYTAQRKISPINFTHLPEDEAAIARGLTDERAALVTRIAELTKSPMVYAGTFAAKPELTFRLHRGDPMQKREAIQAGAVGALPVKFTLETSSHSHSAATNLTEDQQRRLAFAKWMVDPGNPLTARVMVNRIWQHHFGEGLVSTSSDFGANGARPSHPDLLDWLATEFTQHGWSIKHIHRLILNSATYRQASDSRKDGVAIDAGSRLLWRFPPRRLEAEPMRDAILAVSGKLDLQMGGPGFSFFEPNDNYVRVYSPRREWPSETFRRMIYGTIIRQRPDGVFGSFDCPDAGQIAPKRNSSTTPLQAFNLLNSSFMMQQAEFFAERLRKEGGDDVNAQVRRGFALAFQRKPDDDELSAARKLIPEQGLPVFCRALFNANEFVYVF